MVYINDKLAHNHATTLHYTLGDHFPLPSSADPQPFPYDCSSTSYSALVQLYARLGQLPTCHLLFRRGMASSSQCRFGCYHAETVHHLFILCPQFEGYRQSTILDIQRITLGLVESISLAHRDMLMQTIPTILAEESILTWSMGFNTWYYGHSPDIAKDFPFLSIRLVHSLSKSWHTSFIHLAGRIWGHVQRSHYHV